MARPKNTQNIGKYDHKGKTNTTAIINNSKQYSQDIQKYKAYAAARTKSRKYDIYAISDIMCNICDYVTNCVSSGSPATIAGIILHSGSNTDFYYKAKRGEFDFITEQYIIENGIDPEQCELNKYGLQVYQDATQNRQVILSQSSQIIEKCLLLIEDDLQRRSLTDKSMARTTGAIFNLKAVFNYNDKPETEAKTVNNTLIVNANADQTAKAMKLLLDNK